MITIFEAVGIVFSVALLSCLTWVCINQAREYAAVSSVRIAANRNVLKKNEYEFQKELLASLQDDTMKRTINVTPLPPVIQPYDKSHDY